MACSFPQSKADASSAHLANGVWGAITGGLFPTKEFSAPSISLSERICARKKPCRYEKRICRGASVLLVMCVFCITLHLSVSITYSAVSQGSWRHASPNKKETRSISTTYRKPGLDAENTDYTVSWKTTWATSREKRMLTYLSHYCYRLIKLELSCKVFQMAARLWLCSAACQFSLHRGSRLLGGCVSFYRHWFPQVYGISTHHPEWTPVLVRQPCCVTVTMVNLRSFYFIMCSQGDVLFNCTIAESCNNKSILPSIKKRTIRYFTGLTTPLLQKILWGGMKTPTMIATAHKEK